MNTAIVNCFDTYEHRVDLLYKFFEMRGDNVRVYTSDLRHIEKTRRTDNKKNYIYIHSVKYRKNISPQRLISHCKTAADLFRRLRYQDIDLLWVLVPPNSFVRAAAAYKMEHPGTRLVLDVIDMWPETMPLERFKKLPPVELWRMLRDNDLAAADHIVTECELFRKRLSRVVPENKLTTIRLAREITPFTGHPAPPDDCMALCYLGSINNIIDIPAIVGIIRKAAKIKPVTLHIIGDGEKRSELIAASEKAGARVIYHGKLYDAAEKQKIFDKCHFGLNIMKDTVFVGLTMKSIDYFEGGLPIINNIHGDTWDMVKRHNIGINTDQNFDDIRIDRGEVRRFYEASFGYPNMKAMLERLPGISEAHASK